MKLFIRLFFIFTFFSINSINFKIKENLILKTIFSLNSSIEGVTSELIGKSDINTINFKTSFFVNNFGIGFDFKLRFFMYPQTFYFNKFDWIDNQNINKNISNIFDKLDFIKYIDKNFLINFCIGENDYITTGNGFLINKLHNKSFFPNFKELSFLLTADFSYFNNKYTNFIINFYTPDLVDPDIFIASIEYNFTPLIEREEFYLKGGFAFAADFDANEKNFLNSKSINNINFYRNFNYETTLIGLTFPVTFSYINKNFTFLKYQFLNETSFLIKNNNFDIATLIQINLSLFPIKGEHILTIPAGLIFQTKNFYPEYFGFNYQCARSSQYNDEIYNGYAYFRYGIQLQGFNDAIKFNFILTSPFNMNYFVSSYQGEFIFDNRNNKIPVLNNLLMRFIYKANLREMNIYGDGGYFFYSITNLFRFSGEIEYKLYSTGIRFFFGYQSPHWIENDGFGYFLKKDISDTAYVNSGLYNNSLLKFIKVEVYFEF